MKKRVFKMGTGVFGEGRPKICVPIVEETRAGIWRKAEEIAKLSVDLVEWRGDFYQEIETIDEVIATLRGLKERLGEKSLLFTFRTKNEGGNREIGQEAYKALNEAVAYGGADLIDVEVFFCKERTTEAVERIHRAGVKVIGSNHDFYKTPKTGEMVKRLMQMEELRVDVAKLAVMPQEKKDVVRLLEATIEADEKMQIPVVTMSMGEMGMVSRISGRLTGSAMTFAAVGKGSAPGQISAEEMVRILNVGKKD